MSAYGPMARTQASRHCGRFLFSKTIDMKSINKFMLGTKGRMTQVFDDKGVVAAATIITAGPLTLTQTKTVEKDGYTSVQVGFTARKEKHLNKPQHNKPFQYLREFKSEAPSVNEEGTIDVSTFTPGDVVTVSAISKGKGFQGVVKRHGFDGGPRTHGQKNKERAPGSLSGGGRSGGRVVKEHAHGRPHGQRPHHGQEPPRSPSRRGEQHAPDLRRCPGPTGHARRDPRLIFHNI